MYLNGLHDDQARSLAHMSHRVLLWSISGPRTCIAIQAMHTDQALNMVACDWQASTNAADLPSKTRALLVRSFEYV